MTGVCSWTTGCPCLSLPGRSSGRPSLTHCRPCANHVLTRVITRYLLLNGFLFLSMGLVGFTIAPRYLASAVVGLVALLEAPLGALWVHNSFYDTYHIIF